VPIKLCHVPIKARSTPADQAGSRADQAGHVPIYVERLFAMSNDIGVRVIT
jgi:hypothetical protein